MGAEQARRRTGGASAEQFRERRARVRHMCRLAGPGSKWNSAEGNPGKPKEAGQGISPSPIADSFRHEIPSPALSENMSQCREAGMDDCIIKPTRVATLREHLTRWFGAEGVQRAVLDEPGRAAAAAAEDIGRAASGAACAAVADPETLQERPANARTFEPLDLAQMIQLWGGEATVKTLLGSFVSAMRDDLDALPSLLEQADVARLREWHHRAGAVGVLQYPALLAELETFRRHMNSHTAEQLREEGYALIRICQAMLGGIEQQPALLA